MVLQVMSVTQLTDANFQGVNQGRILSLTRVPPGMSFVMFKTNNCGYCTRFMPIFQNMSRKEQRVRFFIADVGTYRSIVGLGQYTNTPIKGVPMFVFYVNGMPKSKYFGKQEEGAVLAFLNKMINEFASHVSTNFVPQQQPQRPPPQQNYGPQPTHGRVNINTAMQGQQLGIGLSQQELERQHGQMTAAAVPEGVIPHNAPWEQYKSIGGLQY